jgi:hypothetical protein
MQHLPEQSQDGNEKLGTVAAEVDTRNVHLPDAFQKRKDLNVHLTNVEFQEVKPSKQ